VTTGASCEAAGGRERPLGRRSGRVRSGTDRLPSRMEGTELAELVDVATAAKLLGVEKTTADYLIERGDLGEVFTLSPTGRQVKRYIRRDQVERLAATDWRRKRRKGDRKEHEYARPDHHTRAVGSGVPARRGTAGGSPCGGRSAAGRTRDGLYRLCSGAAPRYGAGLTDTGRPVRPAVPVAALTDAPRSAMRSSHV
jgi:hypothetical protein